MCRSSGEKYVRYSGPYSCGVFHAGVLYDVVYFPPTALAAASIGTTLGASRGTLLMPLIPELNAFCTVEICLTVSKSAEMPRYFWPNACAARVPPWARSARMASWKLCHESPMVVLPYFCTTLSAVHCVLWIAAPG